MVIILALLTMRILAANGIYVPNECWWIAGVALCISVIVGLIKISNDEANKLRQR